MISEETSKLIDLIASTLAEEDLHQNNQDRYEAEACRVVAALQSEYRLIPIEVETT